MPAIPLDLSILQSRRVAHAIVATSEPRLYGNVIAREGVIYPEGAKIP